MTTPDEADALRARIAELEAENDALADELTGARTLAADGADG